MIYYLNERKREKEKARNAVWRWKIKASIESCIKTPKKRTRSEGNEASLPLNYFIQYLFSILYSRNRVTYPIQNVRMSAKFRWNTTESWYVIEESFSLYFSIACSKFEGRYDIVQIPRCGATFLMLRSSGRHMAQNNNTSVRSSFFHGSSLCREKCSPFRVARPLKNLAQMIL